jgi:hypothetical protein
MQRWIKETRGSESWKNQSRYAMQGFFYCGNLEPTLLLGSPVLITISLIISPGLKKTIPLSFSKILVPLPPYFFINSVFWAGSTCV